MAAGDHGAATMRRYGEAQARLEHAGGYDWRERATAVLRGLGFADEDLDRQLETFSGGELTRASLARALGGDPDLLLLDEPTNHLDVESLEWLERELQSLDAGIIIVAHDRWFLEAVTNVVLELEAGRSTYFSGPWHAWRIEKASRLHAASKAAERIGRDIERLERFVARFRASTEKMARKAQVEADADRAPREGAREGKGRGRSADTQEQAARLRVPEAARAAGARSSRRTVSRSRIGDRVLLGRRELRDRARRARRTRRSERIREDDAARDDPRAARGRGRLRAARARRRSRRTSHSRRWSSTRAARCCNASSAQPACSGRTRRSCSAASSSPVGRSTRSPCSRSRAASGGGSRSRSWSRPARTSSFSTSRRTTSTSRAARRSRRHSRRSRERCCSSHTIARCSTPSPSARSRSRSRQLNSYDGGWAEYVRQREARRSSAPAPSEPKAGQAAQAGPEAQRADGARAHRGRDRGA